MKRQPERRRSILKIPALLFFNMVTIFILIAFFFPHWLPFNHASAVTEVPIVVAPADGTTAATGTVVSSGKPVRIRVPAVNLDVQVVDGEYNANTGNWTLSNNKAHYALITAAANNIEGNTFIYGHRNGVFGALLQTKVGDKAYVETDNNKVFEYVLRESKDVAPSDVSLFLYKGSPILTLQTCSGSWDQNRRLFTFDFINVETKQ